MRVCAGWSEALLVAHTTLLEIKCRGYGAQLLSGRVLDSRPRGRWFEPHRRRCVVSLSKNINPSLVLVQPRKTRPFITEKFWWDVKNQIKQTKIISRLIIIIYASDKSCVKLGHLKYAPFK